MRIFIKSSFFIFSVFILLSPLLGQEEMKDWHHQGKASNFPTGIGSDDWYASQTQGKSRKIIVAILDCGVDIQHPDLKDNIWINPGEIAGNHKDDDGNGYVDDMSGWNFLGGPDGKSVIKESFEVTREYAKGKNKWANADTLHLKGKKKKEYEEFIEIKSVVERKRQVASEHILQVSAMEAVVLKSLKAAKEELDGDSLDLEKLESSENEDVLTAAKIIRNVEDQGMKVESIDWLIEIAEEEFATQISNDEETLNISFNPDYNARAIIGDTYTDFTNRFYGNNNVGGEFALHGTHVSGIVGAKRNNNLGMNGVADNVALMAIKVVPDGDERDKDVANAIIYAVDNGAEVINMSFGKGYSPEKYLVDNAVKYAAKHDVLLVHGAGNESTNVDESPNFPNDTYAKKSLFGPRTAKNFISVGALNPEGGEQSVAEFSNYGKKGVDVYAPGVYIYATTPDSAYEYLSGTSMAAPVVTGLAAMIRSRYPKLSAAQVKDVLIKSARKLPAKVIQPGTYDLVSGEIMGVSGPIDMPAAMKMASQMKGKRKASNMPAEYVKPHGKT
ncbi:MAG TPA: S8 family peptidase [Saprospiraceae bacterium]|nr:S8 family peptidase [Saprospiraceae bacterium]